MKIVNMTKEKAQLLLQVISTLMNRMHYFRHKALTMEKIKEVKVYFKCSKLALLVKAIAKISIKPNLTGRKINHQC